MLPSMGLQRIRHELATTCTKTRDITKPYISVRQKDRNGLLRANTGMPSEGLK